MALLTHFVMRSRGLLTGKSCSTVVSANSENISGMREPDRATSELQVVEHVELPREEAIQSPAWLFTHGECHPTFPAESSASQMVPPPYCREAQECDSNSAALAAVD